MWRSRVDAIVRTVLQVVHELVCLGFGCVLGLHEGAVGVPCRPVVENVVCWLIDQSVSWIFNIVEWLIGWLVGWWIG